MLVCKPDKIPALNFGFASFLLSPEILEIKVIFLLVLKRDYTSPHVVGQGLAPLHFSNKEFEILDLDPPINATSHYGACHFRYNLALNDKQIISYLKRDYIQNGTHHSGMWGCQEGLNTIFQSLCSKNEAAQAPTPPQKDASFFGQPL